VLRLTCTKWDNAYALARFKKSTPEKFEAELDEAGFTEDEKTLVMLKMQVLTMHEAKKGLAESGEEGGAEKHGRFAGQGHSLVQTKEENGEKGKEEGEFGREGEAASNADDKDDAEVVVDATQPVTQVRIAVPGQPPLVAQFNLTHTVKSLLIGFVLLF
jgi:hypothetical protein